MKLLLSGGTGYLGSHVVKHAVEKGWDVVLIIRAGSSFDQLKAIMGDVAWETSCQTVQIPEADLLEEWILQIKPDYIVHAAAVGHYDHGPTDIEPMIAANITLGALLLDACRRYRTRTSKPAPFVFCGSFWQHAGGDNRYKPNSFYAASKTAFEHIAGFYKSAFDAKVLGLKFFDIYGPSDRRGRLMDLLIESLTTREKVSLSPGEQIISPLHVTDAVEAIFHGLSLISETDGLKLTYGVDGPERMSLRAIVKELEALSGKTANIDWGGRDYREREIMVPAVLDRLPDWTPAVGVKQGLYGMTKKNACL